MTRGDNVIQFPSRDGNWLTLERALETAFNGGHLSEEMQQEIRELMRSTYEEYGRRIDLSLALSIPVALNRVEEQVLVNSITAQLQPFVGECSKRCTQLFIELARALISLKKLEKQASAR